MAAAWLRKMFWSGPNPWGDSDGINMPRATASSMYLFAQWLLVSLKVLLVGVDGVISRQPIKAVVNSALVIVLSGLKVPSG